MKSINDCVKKRIAVLISTEEEANEIFALASELRLNQHNMNWKNIINRDYFLGNWCVIFKTGWMQHSSLSYFIQEGYEILPASQFLMEQEYQIF